MLGFLDVVYLVVVWEATYCNSMSVGQLASVLKTLRVWSKFWIQSLDMLTHKPETLKET